jgi:RNA polymerase sigma-B factor
VAIFRMNHAHETNGVKVVEVNGDLDASVAVRLAAVLDGVPGGSPGVLVDLAGTTLIDASAAATLHRAVHAGRKRGARLRVSRANGAVLEVLEIVGVAESLGAHLTRDEALAALAGEPVGDTPDCLPSEVPGWGNASGSAAAPGSGEAAGSGKEPGSSAKPGEALDAEGLDTDGLSSDELSGHALTGEALSGGEYPPETVRTAALAEGVHQLLHDAQALPPGDPRRRSLRQRAVEQALPYARRLAARYRHRGEPVEDLYQVAAMGLVKAVNGYQPERTSGFLGYATPTILGELRRHFRDAGWTLRVPRRLQELRLEVNRAAETLTHSLGRRPSSADLASFLSVPESDVLECLAAAQNYHPVSLSTPLGPGETHQLADAVGAEDPALDLVEYRQSVGPLLATLTPHEREVVALRFFGEMTQSQIAARVGTSQMHVSRLLTAVLGRLRGALFDGPGGADDPAAAQRRRAPAVSGGITRSVRGVPAAQRPAARLRAGRQGRTRPS